MKSSNQPLAEESSFRRTVLVEAAGVSSIVPDLCHLLIRVSSHKNSVTQAKDSTERRVLYIKQAIRNSQVQDSDVKFFTSVEPGFTHTTEIYITCKDVTKLESLSETLTQKLDDTVYISKITYSISSQALTYARSQSASNAVQNARKKAVEMARLVEGSIGSPLSIEQTGCEENAKPAVFPKDDNEHSLFLSWQETCMTVKSTVKAVFEMKPRKN